MTEENYEKLNDKLNRLKEEFEKLYEKNNKVAGTRIRKGMQELKILAQEIRVDVQNRKSKI